MSDAPRPAISPHLPSDVPEAVAPQRHARARAAWDRKLGKALELDGAARGVPEAWFLGPKAENVALLKELVVKAIDSHAAFRRGFHPEDPSHITAACRPSPAFQEGVARLRAEADVLLDKLRLSAPFASMRYQGHMLWDQVMPATVGLFAAMLYNQNNVAAEASPVTTRLEIEVGQRPVPHAGLHGAARRQAARPRPGAVGAHHQRRHGRQHRGAVGGAEPEVRRRGAARRRSGRCRRWPRPARWRCRCGRAAPGGWSSWTPGR